MNTKRILCVLGLLCCIQSPVFSQKRMGEKKNTIIVVEGPVNSRTGYFTMNVNPFRHERFDPWIIREFTAPVKDGYVRWEIETKVAVALMNGLFSYSMAYLAEPGDSIFIDHSGSEVKFSGKGFEKFIIGKKVEEFISSLKNKPEGLPEAGDDMLGSFANYLAWNTYLNQKAKEWTILLDNNKTRISKLAYLDLKDRTLRHIEKMRLRKFHMLRRGKSNGTVNQYGLTNEDLCHIYDTTLINPYSNWLRYDRNYVYSVDYTWNMVHDEDYRRRGRFFMTSKTDAPIFGQDPADGLFSVYNLINKKYTGIVRENLLAYTFYDHDGILHKIGFTPKVEELLAKYYARPGYPEFKKRVREYEQERREKWNRTHTPEFTLTNASGNEFNTAALRGKISVMDFWFTGCTGCVQMAPAMRKVEEHFAKDSNIAFVSISVDKNKDQWLKSTKLGKYTSGGGVQLYTNGEGNDHEVITKMMIDAYPTLEVIDQHGLFIKYEKDKTDPRLDSGKAMIRFLEQRLAMLKDGPYVYHSGDKSIAYAVNGNFLMKQSFSKSDNPVFQVQTDGVSTFPVRLQASLINQPAEYAKPEKLIALSDIEGNFDAFRKLLQNNGVIDKDYNWIFGKGHLVFAGDMFDRGLQVTECLWLIYSLEEKAKAAGGHVHFILGNHEIMNLQGQETNYLKQKYKDNAQMMNKTLAQVYNEDSELGRWLRTKNIVERIGDILFLHGGISKKMNALTLTVSEINQIARPNYAVFNDKYEYGNEQVNTIMNFRTSPFWVRTYYDYKKEVPEIIENTLKKFNVRRIVTGHTIVADTISVHYDRKVINTDTHHADGKSEALLIEVDKYYRVNGEGKKVLLFTDDKKAF